MNRHILCRRLLPQSLGGGMVTGVEPPVPRPMSTPRMTLRSASMPRPSPAIGSPLLPPLEVTSIPRPQRGEGGGGGAIYLDGGNEFLRDGNLLGRHDSGTLRLPHGGCHHRSTTACWCVRVPGASNVQVCGRPTRNKPARTYTDAISRASNDHSHGDTTANTTTDDRRSRVPMAHQGDARHH